MLWSNHDLYFVRDVIEPKYHGETLNESHMPPKLTEKKIYTFSYLL